MASRMIADTTGLFTCELEVSSTVLAEVLDTDDLDELLRAAVTTVLAATTQGPPWPERVRGMLAELMIAMRDQLRSDTIC